MCHQRGRSTRACASGQESSGAAVESRVPAHSDPSSAVKLPHEFVLDLKDSFVLFIQVSSSAIPYKAAALPFPIINPPAPGCLPLRPSSLRHRLPSAGPPSRGCCHGNAPAGRTRLAVSRFCFPLLDCEVGARRDRSCCLSAGRSRWEGCSGAPPSPGSGVVFRRCSR